MQQTLLSRQSLAARWDFESTKVIENYEKAGIITRVPNLPTPRYSLEEIIKIEIAGLNTNPLSPLERIKKDKKIEKLEKEIDLLKFKLNKVQLALA